MRHAVSTAAAIFFLGGLLIGCRPTALATLAKSNSEPTAQPGAADLPTKESSGRADESSLQPTATLQPQSSPSPTASDTPSATIQPPPTATVPPTQTATATPIGPCTVRIPEDDLLALVTLTYALSRDYAPDDLVPLADELPVQVTMGYPSEIRAIALQPLVNMIADMQQDGLQPQILSAYRSYAAQAIAWDKWNKLYPDRAAIISAPPGHSEHQLGTVVDFGSPELASIVGQEDIEFHTYFYKTSEGIWLAENAHYYGFTLSFPAEASEVSGFYYEPWHFRYVGPEMATLLHDKKTSLSEYLLGIHSDPCIP